MNENQHQACLLLGSNIEPEENLRHAFEKLGEYGQIRLVSSVWKTEAVGSHGPSFLNIALLYQTSYNQEALKQDVARSIEERLGRVRSADKNAPRTIDIDIIVFDGKIVDPNLWTRLYVALPVSELMPDLISPHENKKLKEVAQTLLQQGGATLYPLSFAV